MTSSAGIQIQAAIGASPGTFHQYTVDTGSLGVLCWFHRDRCRHRRALVIAALITAVFCQPGCGGSSRVMSSSQQQVPAGGVATTNSYGAVRVQGLPASMSTIRLVS
jgi:hypothetical protein